MTYYRITANLSIYADSDQEAHSTAAHLMTCYSKGMAGSDARLADFDFPDHQGGIEFPKFPQGPRATSTRAILVQMDLDVDSDQEALFVAEELLQWMRGDHTKDLDDDPRLESWSFPDADLIGKPVKPARELHWSPDQVGAILQEHGLQEVIHALALCVGMEALKGAVDELAADCASRGYSYDAPAVPYFSGSSKPASARPIVQRSAKH